MSPIPADYKTVTERIADFKAKHPEGCLRLADPSVPYRIEEIGDATFIVVVAAAFRHPEDPAPGIGIAWEPVPGPTNFTRDSELQNAETSAWGRAIVAVLASESKFVATSEDVNNRRAGADQAAAELEQMEQRARDDGWDTVEERETEYKRLKAATDALPADEQKLVVKDVAKAKVNAWLTREQATWWNELISVASPAASSKVEENTGTEDKLALT